jgi:hypothetical protein
MIPPEGGFVYQFLREISSVVSRQYRIRRAERVPQVRCSTKCNPISDKVEQNRFCCAIQVLHKKGVLFVFVFFGPAAPGPAPGALGPLCAARLLPRPGCVPGASPVGALRGLGRWRRLGLCWPLAFRCRAASTPAVPRPSPSPVGRVLGLAVRPVRPPLRSASLRSRRGPAPAERWARWGPRRPTGRLLPLCGPRAPQTAA